MSRVANKPVTVPAAVEITENGQRLSVKGPKGTLEHQVHHLVEVAREDGELTFKARDESKAANALAGTTRSVVNNLVVGVSDGFEKKLELVGVGYRAQAKGKVLNLSLGFSHPEIRAFRPPEPYKGKGVRYAGEHIVRKEAKKK